MDENPSPQPESDGPAPAAPRSAEDLVFDANLGEFATRISFICGLESNEKITPDEAYCQIKALWKELKRSKRNLLDEPTPGDEA